VADVAGVLLEQVEQHAFQGWRIGAVPALAGLPDLVEIMSRDDRATACRLLGELGQQRIQRFAGSDIPAPVTPIAPRIFDGAALEAPFKPAPLHMAQVLEQFQWGPSRRQRAGTQPGGGQLSQLGGQRGTEIVQVAEEDLGARVRGRGRFGERDRHGSEA